MENLLPGIPSAWLFQTRVDPGGQCSCSTQPYCDRRVRGGRRSTLTSQAPAPCSAELSWPLSLSFSLLLGPFPCLSSSSPLSPHYPLLIPLLPLLPLLPLPPLLPLLPLLPPSQLFLVLLPQGPRMVEVMVMAVMVMAVMVMAVMVMAVLLLWLPCVWLCSW